KITADIDFIKVMKKHGKSLSDTELVSGIVIDKEIAHSQMPRSVSNAKIALLNAKLEIEKTEMDAKININRPEEMELFLQEAKNPKAVTVMVRGGSEHVVDEAERSLHDALCVVRNALEDGKIVAGGGAPEAELSKRLKDFATKAGGREQLAIRAFADALEAIPV